MTELGDRPVNFAVRPFVKVEDYRAIEFDITKGVKKAFYESGASIPFSQHEIHFL